MTSDPIPPGRRPYEKEDVERLLGYFFNGGRWRDPMAPDADMPKAAGNKARQGTEMAETLDFRRAWWACIEANSLLDPALLWGHFAEDMPVSAVAEVLGMSSTTADYRIYRDVEHLTTAINEGRRPRTFNC